ncbi:hypothetical protein E2C01_048099 [Portunus trituberculatus]|uniref:Uncharacterized protein n=1 Tax=Portunus trituberculatus TaxID=210409 RepID=A0A5B7G2S8_PORTR|nr:hypothetical protein [Portunus trituberculatus]
MVMNGLEKLDRENLLIWDTSDTRGHGKKLRKDNCRRDIKKFSFPQRCVKVWNSLDKGIIEARTISEFKEMLDFRRYGDGTALA